MRLGRSITTVTTALTQRLRTIRGRRRQHGKVNDADRREEFIDWFFDRGERLRRAIDSLADEVQAEINA